MKKLIIALISAILVITLCASFVSADAKNLVLSDVEWFQQEGNGANCTIDFSSGKPVISGSTAGTWPAVYATYAPEKCIVADINNYSLHYDFEFATGCTNITFIFSKDNATPDNGFEFPISNTTLGNAQIDSGSGDLQAAHYSGYIKLSDFVNATKNYVASGEDGKFSKDYINSKNELVFSGLRVYSVNGAAITINALELVLNDDATTAPSESGEAANSSDDSSVAESSEAASSVESAESTENTESTVSTESKTEESKPTSSADTSSVTNETSETNNDKGGFPYWIIAVVLAVIVIAVVCVRFVGTGKNK